MNDELYQRLLDSKWRGKLSPAEEAQARAWLAAHLDMESDWDLETGLTDALNRLPDAEMPNNFTARVLSRIQALDRDAPPARESAAQWTRAWRFLFPKTAFVVLVAALGVFTYEQHQAARRAELAHRLATVSQVAAAPDPQVLEDFDTIRRLDQARTARPDEQLLALLK